MRKYAIILREVTYGNVEVEAETMLDAIDGAMRSTEIDWEDPQPSAPFEVRLIGETRPNQ